jgi:pimeloyl-ACP methyl ester carboxylesterase
MIMTLEERFVDAAGYRTAYVETGTGEPVLLLHSADPGVNGVREYRHNFEALSKHFRVIAPDFIGFGNTAPLAKQPPSLSQTYVDHVLAFMDALGIERAHLVGNSRGGLISIAIAKDHPERSGRIILLGNAGGGVSKEYMEKQAALYGNFTPDRETLRDFLAGSFYSVDRDVPPDVFEEYLATAIRQYAAYQQIGGITTDVPDFRADLGKLASAIFFFFGKEDERWPPLPDALDVFINTPNSRFYVLSQCGHHPQTEFPEDFNVLATQFLQGTLR